eukprot:1193337-Prorocentrum_minimum.AAC.6
MCADPGGEHEEEKGGGGGGAAEGGGGEGVGAGVGERGGGADRGGGGGAGARLPAPGDTGGVEGVWRGCGGATEGPNALTTHARTLRGQAMDIVVRAQWHNMVKEVRSLVRMPLQTALTLKAALIVLGRDPQSLAGEWHHWRGCLTDGEGDLLEKALSL